MHTLLHNCIVWKPQICCPNFPLPALILPFKWHMSAEGIYQQDWPFLIPHSEISPWEIKVGCKMTLIKMPWKANWIF